MGSIALRNKSGRFFPSDDMFIFDECERANIACLALATFVFKKWTTNIVYILCFSQLSSSLH
jgi:hypothetical protein